MKILLTLLLLLTIGCSYKSSLANRDTSEIKISTVRWGAEELKEMSKRMAQNILISPQLDFTKNQIYYFGNIRNDSHDQIETKALASKIKTAIKESKKLTFTENKDNHYNYIFRGKISTIFKKSHKTKDMFFNFNLTLTEKRTSTIVWSHTIEMRKVSKRPLLSW
jgi:PBP1b-binding outer membrane lipoprotein LpoB